MPRLPKNTPTVFDRDVPTPAEGIAPSAPARPEENTAKTTDQASDRASEVMIPPAAAARDVPPPAEGKKKKEKRDLSTLTNRRLEAERLAARYLPKAIQVFGKALEQGQPGDRLRAAENILELAAGKNPVANPTDKGRPTILIAPAVNANTAHVLPPDYTPPPPPVAP